MYKIAEDNPKHILMYHRNNGWWVEDRTYLTVFLSREHRWVSDEFDPTVLFKTKQDCVENYNKYVKRTNSELYEEGFSG